MKYQSLGNTDLSVPQIVFGTSCLGNLYEELPPATKLDISREWFAHLKPPVVIDTAGKYGAGLALEFIGKNLRELGIDPDQIVISNKLGWKRVPLTTPEPTFEPGVWMGLQHDAQQCISYEGILECWEQGQELLGEPYSQQLLSVHDPDEYLAEAQSDAERAERLADIVSAYEALGELRASGKAKAVGVGAKDWRVVKEIAERVPLDWVMLANSMTIYRHPPELLEFINWLVAEKVAIINSAVFHAGFLVGGKFFDYRVLSEDSPEDAPIFAWRKQFLELCDRHKVSPAHACVQFALSPPGVLAISLNTSQPAKVSQNVNLVSEPIPTKFWSDLKQTGLIDTQYPYA